MGKLIVTTREGQVLELDGAPDATVMQIMRDDGIDEITALGVAARNSDHLKLQRAVCGSDYVRRWRSADAHSVRRKSHLVRRTHNNDPMDHGRGKRGSANVGLKNNTIEAEMDIHHTGCASDSFISSLRYGDLNMSNPQNITTLIDIFVDPAVPVTVNRRAKGTLDRRRTGTPYLGKSVDGRAHVRPACGGGRA